MPYLMELETLSFLIHFERRDCHSCHPALDSKSFSTDSGMHHVINEKEEKSTDMGCVLKV